MQEGGETPESAFFILDINKKESHQVIHTLNITDLSIIIGIGFQDVEKFIVTWFYGIFEKL